MEQWLDFPPLGPNEKEEMGKNIRKLRKQKGWRQEKLAEVIHKEPPTVSKHESGQQAISLEGLIQYSIALDCKLEDLLPKTVRERLNYEKNPVMMLFNDMDEEAQAQVIGIMKLLAKRAS